MMNYRFKVFLSYLKDNGKMFISFLFIVFIFLLVFYLNRIDIKIIEYALLLAFTLSVVLILVDFSSYYKKYMYLSDFCHKINETMEGFIEANTIIEEKYQLIIKKLYENNSKLISKQDILRTDMIDYYSMWVHQIKTPISAMRILLKTNSSKENLEQELFKIEQYVDMVLNYLRIDEMSDFVLKSYDISNIVKQGIKKYSILFIYKKIKLNFNDKTLYSVTDEKWFLFAFEQILSNALKYTKEGNITISIDDVKREISIEDTGIGIYKEDIPRIFEKGFTGFNGRMDKKSTGIGLYLCKTILSKLSHSISISSELGVSTKVVIGFFDKKIEFE